MMRVSVWNVGGVRTADHIHGVQDMHVLMHDAKESTPLNPPELVELEMTVTELHSRLDEDENATLALQQWYEFVVHC